MSILKEYIKGDIENNKKSYNSTIITIFLAVVILSTFVFGVSSYFKSDIDMVTESIGGYHFRIISRISSKDANNLVSNRHIKKLGFFNIRELEKGFGSKEKTRIFRMDDNALSTIKSWLKEGTLPKDGQVMISNDMSTEIGKTIGDNIEFEGNEYYISGIYYKRPNEYQNFYSIYLNVNQDTLLHSKEELSTFIWYKNIYRTFSLSKKIMENFETKDIVYVYNEVYLNRAFVIDPERNLLSDYITQVLVFLMFIILIILFYSMIVNAFLVQESKSIVEYSKLKSVGATNKDINKLIRLKAIYISQIPILLGMLFSLGLVKLLFLIINRVERCFSIEKEMALINTYLDLKLDFKFILFIYILSILIIYIGTRKPIRKLKKNSILNGLKGNIKSKSHKKYDLKYRGDIEKDLSKQFYKNSKYNFKFTSMMLKIGFLLMVFIMTAFTYYSMDKKYNRVDKYKTYDIQGEYTTSAPLNEKFIRDIKALDIEDLINFRNVTVSLDFDDNLVTDEYKNTGSLSNLKENITSPDNIIVEIWGIEDEKFRELVLERGLNPDDYGGNRAVVLNTMGDNFNVPVSKMESIK
ncbi:MAG: ABC transporter permease, partial [Tissierellaceae bacterium]